MIERWNIPHWSGDFKLEADGEKTVLTVTDPTAAEIKQLADVLTQAKKKGWVPLLVGLQETGTSSLDIKAPITEVGLLVLDKGLKINKGALTVVGVSGGEVTALDGTGASVIEAVNADDAEKAVTTKRPTPCCPKPITGPEKRASKVLKAFCTPQQWLDWVSKGYLFCVGNLTGRLYRIAHRRSKVAASQGRCAWDMAGNYTVHCHASQYPPAEEVLAIKHCLEHREHWLRNQSGLFHVDTKDSFVDPFMSAVRQGADGIPDARITREIGEAIPILNQLGAVRQALGI